MSNLKKDIDNIFKEKLQNNEVIPDPILWDKISTNLPKNKKKKKVALWWYFPIGIAVSLLLLLLLKSIQSVIVDDHNKLVFNKQSSEDCLLDSTELTTNNTREYEKKEEDEFKKNTTNEKIIGISVEDRENYTFKKKSVEATTIASTTLNVFEKVTTDYSFRNSIIEQKLKIQEVKGNTEDFAIQSKKSLDTILNVDTLPKTDDNLIVSNITGDQNGKEIEVETQQITKRKWSVQPQIAPLVYNSISGNSSIEANFQNSVASTNAGISLGIKIAYQATSKWQIRSGLSTANITVFTNQINNQSLFSGEVSSIQLNDFENELNESQVDNIFEEPAASAPILAEDANQQPTNSDVQRPAISTEEGTLQQQISYIEIPIEFTYQILNKRFGATLIGGASAFILNQNNNEIFFKEAGSRRLIGCSNNLRSTSFSGNIGVGLNYKISDKIKINIEPTLKIQFNAFDSNTDFNPYIFGAYSGIIFKL